MFTTAIETLTRSYILSNSTVTATANTDWVEAWMDGELALNNAELRALGVKCSIESGSVAHYTQNGETICRIDLDELFGVNEMRKAQSDANAEELANSMRSFMETMGSMETAAPVAKSNDKNWNQLIDDAYWAAEWNSGYNGAASTIYEGYGIVKVSNIYTIYALTSTGLMGEEVATVRV